MVPTAVRLSLSAALVALLHEVILPTCTPEQASFDAAIRLFGADPARAFVLTIVCIHAAIFLGMNLLLTGLDASGLLAEWRLQPGRWPPAELMWRAARLIALNQLLVQPLMLIGTYPLYTAVGGTVTGAPMPSPAEILGTVAVSILCEDVAFYWAHRALHTRALYRAVHKVHHQFHVPCGWSAEYAHPLEYLVTNAMPMSIGPLACAAATGRLHLFTVIIWNALRFSEAIDAHSGYDWGLLSPFALLYPFRRSPEEHDWHHSKNRTCRAQPPPSRIRQPPGRRQLWLVHGAVGPLVRHEQRGA